MKLIKAVLFLPYQPLLGLLVFGLLAVCGCGNKTGPSGERLFQPVNSDAAVFWDRQTTESAELLRSLVEEFNAGRQGLPVKIERSGNYADIFRKVTAGINAGVLPAMAVSYESMTSEYIPLEAVCNLDPLVDDPALGLTEDEKNDFFPGVMQMNRYPEHGNHLYSFPFAKSLLVLYFNKKVLAEAGIAKPPETWAAFLEQCRLVKAATGRFAHAVHADCSTVNGMLYSMGGDIVRGRETLYDSPQSLEVFKVYETLAREELAYLISPGTYDDNLALAKDEVAFVLRSSSGLSDMMLLMEGDKERWGLAWIPQKDPGNPATVLYGPNVCIFKTDKEQIRVAWEFVKYFTTPEMSARWALETGYLPVRKSALELPEMLSSWEQWPYNRVPYDCLPLARPEPNIAGWQHVRDLVARAVTEIMTGADTAENAAATLKRVSDEALKRAVVF